MTEGYVDCATLSVTKLATREIALDEGDYQKDGLWYCGACNTPKQCRVTVFGEEKTVPCLCRCTAERIDAEMESQREREKLSRIYRLKTEAIQDKRLLDCTFANDDGGNPAISKLAHSYVDNWEKMLEMNQGLILCGDVGCGKTFAAGCITNALADKGIPVLATDFKRIIDGLSGEKDRSGYIASLDKYNLLLIDDLGAERQSDYALETVFTVINQRYKAKLPMILTTNMSVEEIQQPADVRYSRIYDRIIEMCVPVAVRGESRRKKIAKEKRDEARKILFG